MQKAVEELSHHDSYNKLCYQHIKDEPMPSIEKLKGIVDQLREIVFPGYFGETKLDPIAIKYYMGVYIDSLYESLSKEILAGLCFSCAAKNEKSFDLDEYNEQAKKIAAEFISSLPEMRRILATDVEAAFFGDPAATSRGEVIFCYPAMRAISSYRFAHKLHDLGVPLIPRIISEMAHSETGIDIHPRAKIGEYFTIDHGTGVVVGATSIIGRNVKIYQGVTLGAKSFPLDEKGNPIKGIPRHPIIEDDVIIYAQATILGRITVGKGSVIGANVWVTSDVPPDTRIVQTKPKHTSFIDGAGI